MSIIITSTFSLRLKIPTLIGISAKIFKEPMKRVPWKYKHFCSENIKTNIKAVLITETPKHASEIQLNTFRLTRVAVANVTWSPLPFPAWKKYRKTGRGWGCSETRNYWSKGYVKGFWMIIIFCCYISHLIMPECKQYCFLKVIILSIREILFVTVEWSEENYFSCYSFWKIRPFG